MENETLEKIKNELKQALELVRNSKRTAATHLANKNLFVEIGDLVEPPLDAIVYALENGEFRS